MSSSLQNTFDEYFQVEDSNQVNLFVVQNSDVPQTQAELEKNIPALFKLANEINELDSNALRPLRNLGDVATELASFLQAQSRKIDLIMSHILATEQPDEDNVYCDSYGGGGLKVTLAEKISIGTQLRTKLFLNHEASAIYCYTQVIAVERLSSEKLQHTLGFTQIRDADQELVVRASLHAQTRQLKKRQLAQNKEQNS
ncbi:PilZ domain-containing protein [Pseudoalteromonas sp. MMG013]|uniref:PilZ domain-containing protein n=1 Tax=Pseudoalteromonas sp. MMG013 TaxID=2822687 RepID=UPI001B379063|nr:PilZ domain-containing protein [Pseudoalteromonas sp. MMG013]MBQ4864668.1 PilZ domain-containing protein [Pseudoalteromonas sp. MMG013]